MGTIKCQMEMNGGMQESRRIRERRKSDQIPGHPRYSVYGMYHARENGVAGKVAPGMQKAVADGT